MATESQPSSSLEMGEISRNKAMENEGPSGSVSINQGAIERYRLEPTPDEPDEYEPPEVGRLTAIDVFGFIVNKMIGTGIYTSPIQVLILTGSRDAAIGLWVVGVVYTFVSMYIYLNYAAVVPYNTGELVYLDEITSHEDRGTTGSPTNPIRRWIRRYMGNGLFAYTIYAFLFVATFNSGTNCMQIAQQLLIAIRREDEFPEGGILRFSAVTALSIVCLFHYFTPALGRKLNVAFAFMKIGFLLALIFAGCDLKRKNEKIATFYPAAANGHSNYAKALLLIIFAFEGWENANFIAGEIPRGSHHVLRKGFLWAVNVVSLLYLSINGLFLFDLVEYRSDPATQVNKDAVLKLSIFLNGVENNSTITRGTSVAPLFFSNSVPAIRCWGVLTAISALGSVISVVYTFARVKQAIGRMNILPWSNLWGADDNQQHPAETGDLDKTPMGGLILHWITTVVAISASASIKSSLINAISFPGIVQAYAHSLILIPLSLGFFRIRSLADTLGFNRNDLQLFDRALASFWLSDDWTILGFLALIILAYVACNTFLVVDYVIPPYSGVPGWISLVICSIVIAIAIVYYFSFFASFIPDPDADPNVEADLNARGGLEQTQLSLLRLADVTMHIVKAESFDESTSRARRFGTRRKITYQNGHRVLLYWLFGGTNLDRTPWERVADFWDRITSWVWTYRLWRPQRENRS